MKRLSRVVMRVGHAVGALFAAGNVKAALVTQTYNFSANSFYVFFGPSLPPPIPTISGSFTVTYDNTLSYADGTTGLVINSLSTNFGTPVGFIYSPSGSSALIIGGMPAVGSVGNGTSDFSLIIDNVMSGSPTFTQLTYTTVGTPSIWATNTGSVMVANSVPEPTTWATMLAGFGLMGASLRRGQRVSVRYV